MLHCPSCGYNLTGVCTPEKQTADCPECGVACRYEELVGTGGVEQKNLIWPIMLVVVLPGLAGLAALVMLHDAGGSQPLAVGVGLLGGVLGLAAVGVAVFAARRIARRIAMRPVQSRPNSSSVTLTIAFSIMFVCTQMSIAFVTFFFGCLATLNF